ncbi:hypothetical protein JTB14_031373 [Gonioctena quinquepunctata]|nr:hypothetical protein JTB14_031373 [Gonioctena quinquepunctata]
MCPRPNYRRNCDYQIRKANKISLKKKSTSGAEKIFLHQKWSSHNIQNSENPMELLSIFFVEEIIELFRYNIVSKKRIPRGYRKDYIPGWSKDSEALYQEYSSSVPELPDDIIYTMRLEKWSETVTNMVFKHYSRKAWSLLRKLRSSTSSAITQQ